MRRICSVIACLLLFYGAAAAEDMQEITAIRKTYADTKRLVSGGQLNTQEITATLLVIPGIGSPVQHAVFYHALDEGPSGETDFSLRLITYYYQHAGRLFYEEFLFDEAGELIFYFAEQGNGDIYQPEETVWNDGERYYFSGGKLIRKLGGDITEGDTDSETYRKSELILAQARSMRAAGKRPAVPLPLSFLE